MHLNCYTFNWRHTNAQMTINFTFLRNSYLLLKMYKKRFELRLRCNLFLLIYGVILHYVKINEKIMFLCSFWKRSDLNVSCNVNERKFLRVFGFCWRYPARWGNFFKIQVNWFNWISDLNNVLLPCILKLAQNSINCRYRTTAHDILQCYHDIVWENMAHPSCFVTSFIGSY